MVLATSTPITVAVPALVKKIFQQTPFVFEVRDVWPEAPVAIGVIRNSLLISFLKWFEKTVYRRASHIVALSTDMKSSIVQRTNTHEEKITVIPNIANLERFAKRQAAHSILHQHLGFTPKRSILYAGAIGIINGLHALVELAKHTRDVDPELVYILTGWGIRKKQVMQLASESGLLNKNIYFLPPVPKSSIPQLYAECTVTSSFVLPVRELWANSANKFFDGLAAGKPIVINYEGWQADLVRQRKLGYVLPYESNNMKNVAAAFCAYMNDEETLNVHGNNAREAAKLFSLPGAGHTYLRILEKVNEHVNQKTRNIR
jgi:glycosyltransferase involved in cell wall biosynthesis